jgi:sulfur relay (sulfurtransferase) DsrC/TusE family protein
VVSYEMKGGWSEMTCVVTCLEKTNYLLHWNEIHYVFNFERRLFFVYRTPPPVRPLVSALELQDRLNYSSAE